MFVINVIRHIIFDVLFPFQLSDPYGSASLLSTSKLFASSSTTEGLDSPNELFTPTIQYSGIDDVTIPDEITDHVVCDVDSVPDECSDATTTYSSDEDSETSSILSSATSEDLDNERVESMLIEDADLFTESDECIQQVCSQLDPHNGSNKEVVARASIHAVHPIRRTRV